MTRQTPATCKARRSAAGSRSACSCYIERAKQDGARCVTGGGVPAHLPRGFYVEPTLIVGADPRSQIAQEEVFGPVLVALPYDDDADAIRIANDSIYGLSGAVHGSTERAMRVARAIRAGTMSVNGGGWFHVDTPFGGYKQSGVGRENGELGFEEYLETKRHRAAGRVSMRVNRAATGWGGEAAGPRRAAPSPARRQRRAPSSRHRRIDAMMADVARVYRTPSNSVPSSSGRHTLRVHDALDGLEPVGSGPRVQPVEPASMLASLSDIARLPDGTGPAPAPARYGHGSSSPGRRSQGSVRRRREPIDVGLIRATLGEHEQPTPRAPRRGPAFAPTSLS